MSLKGNSLKGDFARFVIPTIVTLWIYHMYIIADGIFVSRGVSHTGLSAINLARPFTNLLFSVGVLVAVGTSTIAAIYMGRKETEYASSMFTQSIVVIALAGAALSLVVKYNLESLVSLLGAKEETFNYVKDYIRGLTPFSAFFVISYYLEVLIKTDGYPYRATLIVGMGCILNCILDYLFIFVFHLGVWGAAVATGISQMIVVAVYLCHFIWGKGTFRLKPFKPDMKMLGRITLIGIPEGITELCTGVTVFMFNHIIIAFLGEDHIIYYTVSAYVNTLVIMTMVAISQGLQPLVSFYLGRKEMDICKKLLRYGFIVSSVIAVTAFAGLNLLAKQVVAAFIADTNSEVFSTSVAVFRKFSISFLFIGINVVTAGFLTAMGQPKGAFIISVGRGLILPVTALILLAYATGGSGIWWAQLFSEVVCVVLSVILLKKERRNFGKLKLGSISPK